MFPKYDKTRPYIISAAASLSIIQATRPVCGRILCTGRGRSNGYKAERTTGAFSLPERFISAVDQGIAGRMIQDLLVFYHWYRENGTRIIHLFVQRVNLLCRSGRRGKRASQAAMKKKIPAKKPIRTKISWSIRSMFMVRISLFRESGRKAPKKQTNKCGQGFCSGANAHPLTDTGPDGDIPPY